MLGKSTTKKTNKRIHPEKRPNAKTLKAMEEARKGKTIKAKDISELKAVRL